MGKVITTLKIMPTGVDVDIDSIRTAVDGIDLAGGKITDVKIEDVAFGLKALVIMIMNDDAEGGTDAIQDNVSKIDGVSTIEVMDVQLL